MGLLVGFACLDFCYWTSMLKFVDCLSIMHKFKHATKNNSCNPCSAFCVLFLSRPAAKVLNV